jgi:hypothetical protein
MSKNWKCYKLILKYVDCKYNNNTIYNIKKDNKGICKYTSKRIANEQRNILANLDKLPPNV